MVEEFPLSQKDTYELLTKWFKLTFISYFLMLKINPLGKLKLLKNRG